MEISIQGAPIYFTIPIFGGIPITASILITWVIMVLLTGLCIFLTHNMKITNVSKRQAIAEFLVNTAENFVHTNMSEKFWNYGPFIAAIFSLSIFSSLSSLLGLFPPTADVSTTLAWALLVFVIITYQKIRTNGMGGYLKSFCDPIFVMAPFNVLGEVFTPISMAFRHFGNIVSGVVITALIYAALLTLNQIVFGWLPGALGEILGSVPILAVGVPAAFSLYFDWFGSAIQAFIFCMLTMMFVTTAAE